MELKSLTCETIAETLGKCIYFRSDSASGNAPICGYLYIMDAQQVSNGDYALLAVTIDGEEITRFHVDIDGHFYLTDPTRGVQYCVASFCVTHIMADGSRASTYNMAIEEALMYYEKKIQSDELAAFMLCEQTMDLVRKTWPDEVE